MSSFNVPPEDTFLPPPLVAKLIHRSEQTLANDRANGRGLPYCRFGRSIRYRLSDILAAAESTTVVAGRTPGHPGEAGDAR